MTTFLQKENHNISQSWEHKQFWRRAQMFQQQKMTGGNVSWMVFAHQGRAAVTVLLCLMEGVKSSRIQNVKWGKGRLQALQCHTEVTLFLFLCIASVILPVFFIQLWNSDWNCRWLQPGRPGDNSDLQENSQCRGGRSHCKHTFIFCGEEHWLLLEAAGHNLCLSGFSVHEVLFYLSLHKPPKMS